MITKTTKAFSVCVMVADRARLKASLSGLEDVVEAYYAAAEAEAKRQGFRDFRELQLLYWEEMPHRPTSTQEAGKDLAEILNALPAGFWKTEDLKP